METTPTVEIDKKYAILIGINAYLDDIVRTLKYSVADVKAFYDILTDPTRGSYNLENVRLFIDENPQSELAPTRSNIMSQMSSLASMATTKDNLLVYFSGHGIEKDGESYLLPQDARYNILRETAISINWIREVLVSSNARVKLVILDACHSGAIKGKSTSGFMTKGFQESIFPPPEGFAVLSSCKMNEVSWEDDEMKHGVFSYFLAEGLRGAADYDQNSKISVMETSKYCFEKVSSWALAHSRKQSPTLECSIFGDIVLCQVPSDYVRPSPMEIPIAVIRLGSEVFEEKLWNDKLGKICGLLINFMKADDIEMKSEDEIRFPEGKVSRFATAEGYHRVNILFDYDKKNRQNVEKLLSRLDDSEILKFDEIEFSFSSEMDLSYLAESFRKRGFNILSYNPSEKSIKVELPSDLEEQITRLTIKETKQGVSIEFKNEPAFFKPGFYERINPKSVMELSTSMQKEDNSEGQNGDPPTD